jgi:hypothetical protein
MKVKYVSIFTIVLVLTSGIPLISAGSMNYASAKYATNTQTQANSNDCDTGTNCAISSPQTQGDGSASSPINLQITETNGLLNGAPNTPPDIIIIESLACDSPHGAWVTCNGNLFPLLGFPSELICRMGVDRSIPPPFLCRITILPFLFQEFTNCEIITPQNPQRATSISHWRPIPPA